MNFPGAVPLLVFVLSVRNCLLAVAGLWLVTNVFREALERPFRRIETLLSRFANRRGLAVAGVFVSVVLVRVSVLRFLPVPVPYVHDEYSYLLLGDTFAHGRLANPTHPLWRSFDTFHVNWFPTYSAMHPPAQGFALALGFLLGHPWIGVLLSEAAMCAAILWMLQAWMPARWALLGASLAALKLGVASYWMNSYWGGAMAATGGALVLGALGRILRRPRLRDALWMGIGIAILANSRPYEGMVFCIPSAVYIFWLLLGRAQPVPGSGLRITRVLLPLMAVCLAAGAFIAYYDWRATGNPFLMPHVQNTRTHSASIFLWDRTKPPRSYPNPQFDRFYNDFERLSYQPTGRGILRASWDKLVYYSFGFFWCGAWLLLPCVPRALRSRKLRFLLVTLIVAGLGSCLVAWPFAHYVAALTCVLFAFVAQAIRYSRAGRGSGRRWGLLLSRAAVLLLVVISARDVWHHVCDSRIGGRRGNFRRDAILQRLRNTQGKHLVVVRYDPSHDPHDEWVFNGADLDGAKVLWARHLDSEQNGKLVQYFRDRRAWLVEPDRDPGTLSPYPGPTGVGALSSRFASVR